MSWDRRPTPRAAARRLLDTVEWKVKIRARFQEAGRPCARCGVPIDYGGSYYIPGTRRKNRRYLHVGHIIERDKAVALGWTDAEINHPSNLQPECASCSSKSGAQYGRSKQTLSVVHNELSLDNSRDW